MYSKNKMPTSSGSNDSISNVDKPSSISCVSLRVFFCLILVVAVELPIDTVNALLAQAGMKKFICVAYSQRSLYISKFAGSSSSYKSIKSAGAPDFSLIRLTFDLSK